MSDRCFLIEPHMVNNSRYFTSRLVLIPRTQPGLSFTNQQPTPSSSQRFCWVYVFFFESKLNKFSLPILKGKLTYNLIDSSLISKWVRVSSNHISPSETNVDIMSAFGVFTMTDGGILSLKTGALREDLAAEI